MAKNKFKTVEMEAEPAKKKQSYEEKKAKREVSAEVSEPTVETDALAAEATVEAVAEEQTKGSSQVSRRGKNYTGARAQIDRTKSYKLREAIELLKKVKYSSFDETLEAHLVLKDITPVIEVSYPHSTGKVTRVAILDDELIAKLDKGIIEFDILLATPAQMGKITKFARLLGPKGMMPNPKNGTLTQDPAKRKAELEGGKTTVKGEKKAPLMHALIGKISSPTDTLAENTEALIKAFLPGKVLKVTVCTSMSPGVRVQL